MNYLFHIATIWVLRLMAQQSMNLYFGYAGILGLSHAAFYGIGAYTLTLTFNDGGSFILGLLYAVLLTFTMSLLLGLTAIRLRRDYLGIATLGFAQIVIAVMFNWNSLTNGALGLRVGRPEFLGVSFASTPAFFFLTLLLCAPVVWLMYRLIKAPFGRTLETIRDDEEAAQSLGINTNYYKLLAFAIGSSIAAFTGAIHASYVRFIDPNSFNIENIAFVLIGVVVGGMGTFRGPFIGATFLTVVIEGMRFLPIDVLYIGPLRPCSWPLLFY